MSAERSPSGIWWIRRDVRLHDNPALQAALEHAETVIPVFIMDAKLLSHSNPRRNTFLFENLRQLEKELQQIGSRLIVRRGNPRDCLQEILQESNAQMVFAQRDHSPYAQIRDADIAAVLPLTLTTGITIQPESRVRKEDGTPYTVFTPYARAWMEHLDPITIFEPPTRLQPIADLYSEPIPPSQSDPLFPAGEENALQCLRSFLSRQVKYYRQNRDLPAEAGTSRLSPSFHLGVLSSRLAFHEAQSLALSIPEQSGIGTWINELLWREFFTMILANFPQVVEGPFREKYSRLQWRNDEREFFAWKKGLTGYPFVDAGMRQLQEIGWMHNRVRMVAASFLCKDLLVNWQWGEEWFLQNLIDGDLAANNGGWQWSAGTGTDAAPYFRVFNPITQSKRFDSDGKFIRQWLPELSSVPAQYIHTPWKMPLDVQQDCGCMIGAHYPPPLIDHATARQRILSAYRQMNA